VFVSKPFRFRVRSEAERLLDTYLLRGSVERAALSEAGKFIVSIQQAQQAMSRLWSRSCLPMMKRTLKQLSNDEPTISLARQNDQKLLQKAVATEAKKPTALQDTSAGILP